MSAAALIEQLRARLEEHLRRQPWFSPAPGRAFEVVEAGVLREVVPMLVWAVLADGPLLYQLLLGLRPRAGMPEHLAAQEAVLVGPVDLQGAGLGGPGEAMVAYDAAADPELGRELLVLAAREADGPVHLRAPGDTGTQGSPDVADVSHGRVFGTSGRHSALVFDEKVFLKILRRVGAGAHPDVEMNVALDRVGFNHMPAPIALWRRNGRDLAVVQEFLGGGTGGWAMALTSLRDAYGSPGAHAGRGLATGVGPAEVVAGAGGDFASEARRLGETTARLHLALGEAFGVGPGDGALWAAELVRDLRCATGAEPAGREEDLLAALRSLGTPGAAIRVHGAYHLGKVMRSEVGWFVLDFGEDPVLAEERRGRCSPLHDVASMLRSFNYASEAARRSRAQSDWDRLAMLALSWERRNRGAFLEGYLGTPGIEALLPPAGDSFEVVLSAMELGKVHRELAYEAEHRPQWATIPSEALERFREGPPEP